VDSGKLEGDDFNTNVCQLVSIFLERHIFMMAAKK